jgi:CTP synthase (UTP-ammonia lyase)
MPRSEIRDPSPCRIAIIGDFDPGNGSHPATNACIAHCSARLGLKIDHRWIATDEVTPACGLQEFSGFWIGPGSPYRSMEGALLAIQIARENGIPFLGTCGGFQHIIIEYARSVLGIANADHEESAPHAPDLVISRLACSLAGRSMSVSIKPGSLAARSYGRTISQERYLCNFGVNPSIIPLLRSGDLQITGSDDEGEARMVELARHPFFLGTLFLPQLSSTHDAPHPLVLAFLQHCLAAGAKAPGSALHERESVIRLSRNDAQKVLSLLDSPPKPAKALRDAVKAYRNPIRA